MIGIALQSGSWTSGAMFSPLMLSLNECLEHAIDGEHFSKDIHRVIVVFRVSGRIADFEFAGVDRVKCYTKKKEIRMDYGFTESSWNDVDPSDLRPSIAHAIRESLNAAIGRLGERKLALPSRAYLAAVQHAINDWVEDAAESV